MTGSRDPSEFSDWLLFVSDSRTAEYAIRKFGGVGGGPREGTPYPDLEALDELGCRPCVIAGTSMGALMGALYASGVPGRTLRENIEKNIISRRDTWRDIFTKRSDLLKALRTMAFERGSGGAFRADRFLNFLLASVHKRTFEELEIPLRVIATDYWSGEEVVLESGRLLPALKASMAIPGVFAPVRMGNRELLDGGLVDLVPYGHILGRCEVSIAVNVAGARIPGKSRVPNVWESVLGSFEIMQDVNLAEKMKHLKPDLYVHPEIVDVPILSFRKAARVLRQAAPAVKEMKDRLQEILSHS